MNWYNSLTDKGDLVWSVANDLCSPGNNIGCNGLTPQNVISLYYLFSFLFFSFFLSFFLSFFSFLFSKKDSNQKSK